MIHSEGKANPRSGLFVFIMVAVCVLMCLAIIYPLSILLFGSFRIEKFGQAGFYSLANYVRAFTDPRIVASFSNTLIVCIGTSVLPRFRSIPRLGIGPTNYPFRKPWRSLISALFLSPGDVRCLDLPCCAKGRAGQHTS
jgi:ABC-type spermidine/putrescine transport system permease subunit II